jgi:hypothetical protein
LFCGIFLLCQSSFTSHGGLRFEMFIFRTRRRIVRDEDLGEGGGNKNMEHTHARNRRILREKKRIEGAYIVWRE